jgi:alkylated DNA repair dioxygenase AlkB
MSIEYIPNFVKNPDAVFAALMVDLPWEQRPDAPRMEYWTNIYSRPYTYGKDAGMRTYESRATHPEIEAVSDKLRDLLGFRYEGCFLNAYKGERDWLGWHADDDEGINHNHPIAVVTVGAGRMLQTKPQGAKGVENITDHFLEPGSLFLMGAGMQSTHYHRIPKAGRKVDPRISLTFRALITEAEYAALLEKRAREFALMESSKTAAEWDDNCDKIKL